MSAWLSGDRIESESDSVPETACCDVATLGPSCFYKIPRTVTEGQQKKWTVMSAYTIEIEAVKTGIRSGVQAPGKQIEGCVLIRIVICVLTLGCLGVE